MKFKRPTEPKESNTVVEIDYKTAKRMYLYPGNFDRQAEWLDFLEYLGFDTELDIEEVAVYIERAEL